MIRSFRDKEAERIFLRRRSRKLPAKIQQRARRRLLQIHAAKSLKELRIFPANRLEKLSGDRKGQHSIRINDQWRVCFVWTKGDAHDIEIVDYH